MTGTMMGKMGVQPILPIMVLVVIDTMLNFDGDFDGDGRGDVMCEQTLNCKRGIVLSLIWASMVV